jgi:hypothetical protein
LIFVKNIFVTILAGFMSHKKAQSWRILADDTGTETWYNDKVKNYRARQNRRANAWRLSYCKGGVPMAELPYLVQCALALLKEVPDFLDMIVRYAISILSAV